MTIVIPGLPFHVIPGLTGNLTENHYELSEIVLLRRPFFHAEPCP